MTANVAWFCAGTLVGAVAILAALFLVSLSDESRREA
jgi:hypothetical protein